MKKYLLFSFLIFTPFYANANVPTNTFFFADGKGYNIEGKQTHFCFLDGNCYDLNQKFAFSKEVPIVIPSSTDKIIDSNISLDFACINGYQWPYTPSSVMTLSCDTNTSVLIKSISVDVPTKSNGDFITLNEVFSTLDNSHLGFIADSSNTVFNREIARVTIPIGYSINTRSDIIKVVGLYPVSVLVNFKGKDIVYKVN